MTQSSWCNHPALKTQPWLRYVAALLLLGLFASSVRADDAKADQAFADKVARRLLAVIDPVADLEWPPSVEVVDGKQINAFATVVEKRMQGRAAFCPKVAVYSGLMREVVQGDADRLAFILGHEFAHITLGHCVRQRASPTEFLRVTFTREQEAAADIRGTAYLLKAGYSPRRAVVGVRRMIELGVSYNSFEGLRADHPSWGDRLALIDRERATLWREMSAFDNGVYFLAQEQYATAERCFREVTKEFPDCHEAWANLGLALLAQYCDALDPDDLRQFDVGQMLVGAFYRRPESLEARVRGINEELWEEAVAALRESLRLKRDQVVAKANLGVAYLVRPTGKSVGEARRHLDEAAARAATDPALPPLTRASVVVNAGVAALAAGDAEAGARQLRQGEELGRKAAPERARAAGAPALSSALRYNRALALARSSEKARRREAAGEFESYLRAASPASAWWPLAYERYTRLCGELELKPKPRAQLSAPGGERLRMVTSVKLASGAVVALNEALKDVRKALGDGQKTPVIRDANLLRIRYPAHGVDLLAADRVLAICLTGPKSPSLTLRGRGLGGKPVVLRVGMARDEFERLLDAEDFDFRELDQADTAYRFYHEIGLAARVRQGKVTELVVAQVPRRPAFNSGK